MLQSIKSKVIIITLDNHHKIDLMDGRINLKITLYCKLEHSLVGSLRYIAGERNTG